MSVFIRGKKASHLAIGGKSINKAWNNGKLIFQKGGNISFGILTWNDASTGLPVSYEITEASDYNKLFDTDQYRNKARNISFSFATISSYDIIGWEWNTNNASAQLYSSNVIGVGFLANLPYLNSDINIPDWITTISDRFMFTSSNIISSGVIPQFNSNITFGNGLTTINNNFMSGCNRFNKPINTNNVRTIGNYFFNGQTGYGDVTTFNNTVEIPNVETIGTYFMANHSVYNNTFTFNNIITSIGTYFLRNAYAFNKALNLPATLLNIGSGFLYSCISFNKNLVIPANCTCGGILANGGRDNKDDTGMSFNSILTISEGASITGSFLGYLKSTVHPTVVVNTDASNITTNVNSLVSNSITNSKPYITAYLKGPYAQALYDAFKGVGTDYGYRNLSVVTE